MKVALIAVLLLSAAYGIEKWDVDWFIGDWMDDT